MIVENTRPSTLASSRTKPARRARLRHGLFSHEAVIPGEDPEEFEQFRAALLADLQPESELERLAADQMVLAHWQLQRVTAIQTGVYERYAAHDDADASESYPMWLARCFARDAADSRTLDRMSLHEVRLVNRFHKAAKLVLLCADLRRKGLARAAPQPGLPSAFDAPAAGPAPEVAAGLAAAAVQAATASSDAASREIADRRAPSAAEAARSPVTPTAPRGYRPAPQLSAAPGTRSSDGASGEIADRGGAALPLPTADAWRLPPFNGSGADQPASSGG